MPAVWSVCDTALVHLKDTPVFETVIPSKIFEAFGMGVPVLFAGPEGEGSEIVRRAGAGPCVAAEDPVALSIAVRALASNPDQHARYAANAHGAAPQYDREVLARRLLDILLDVAAGRPTRVAERREDAARAG
jgi:glycosyltransferase involved in cell wall biosynthesis